ncbi:hypothetical protein [Microvirga arabica]|uniref:Calcium-binding protein n=1 Tax=Microvirga arabica TaxID=1128671 RepID=A0ABV6YBP5_9HYPH
MDGFDTSDIIYGYSGNDVIDGWDGDDDIYGDWATIGSTAALGTTT